MLSWRFCFSFVQFLLICSHEFTHCSSFSSLPMVLIFSYTGAEEDTIQIGEVMFMLLWRFCFLYVPLTILTAIMLSMFCWGFNFLPHQRGTIHKTETNQCLCLHEGIALFTSLWLHVLPFLSLYIGGVLIFSHQAAEEDTRQPVYRCLCCYEAFDLFTFTYCHSLHYTLQGF